jgi:2-keto-4-pentenoate hydratase
MTDSSFDAACRALVEARRSARRIESLSTAWLPRSLEDACRLQQAVAAELGAVRGWKISGVTPEQQRVMGVACPLAGPLLAPWLRESGAAFELARFVWPRLECEFAFELKRDLPGRATPWSRAEVEAAIGALRVVIEVVDSRLPPGSPVLMELADDLNNGAFVVGPATGDWRAVRYAEQAIVLRGPGGAAARTELARGDGRAVLGGDPAGAVVLLANLLALRQRGLRAGDIVTTGSCTGALPVSGPGDYEADFGALGRVAVRLLG